MPWKWSITNPVGYVGLRDLYPQPIHKRRHELTFNNLRLMLKKYSALHFIEYVKFTLKKKLSGHTFSLLKFHKYHSTKMK